MLVLYSQLKKYLPDLNDNPSDVAQVFTSTGQMIDKLVEVEYQGAKDYLMDLEVRQNRADCYGVLGLARELSAYYNISLKFPENKLNDLQFQGDDLDIEVRAKESVKRLMALKFTNLNISDSPDWLREYLELYGINSINNLVDITNYVMLETGLPSHVFDTDLVGDRLVWEINSQFSEFITLNGNKIDISGISDLLTITNEKKLLSLSFIGGSQDAVSKSTKNIILEMGLYDGGLVRRNGRRLSVITEAGQRLEKYIDPEMIPIAFSMLVEMIQEHCGGDISSQLFDEYINKSTNSTIEIRIKKISEIAGVNIEKDKSIEILKNLGFKIISESEEKINIERPLNRLDISIEEDCIEEIIRMYGYSRIPKDQLMIEVTKEITPSHLKMIDHIQDQLEAKGFDEVRSWVLVEEEKNNNASNSSRAQVKVEDSINEEVPYLRQSISVNLFEQFENYKKNNISDVRLFEIGKVFEREGDTYFEHNTLGILMNRRDINDLRLIIEELLRFFEINEVLFRLEKPIAKTAHPENFWKILVKNHSNSIEEIGYIYLSNKTIVDELVVCEINLDKLNQVALGLSVRSVHEITNKIIELDTNIISSDSLDIIQEEIIRKLANRENVWSWRIIDEFQVDNRNKITIRVSYFNLSDQDAKKLHDEIFG